MYVVECLVTISPMKQSFRPVSYVLIEYACTQACSGRDTHSCQFHTVTHSNVTAKAAKKDCCLEIMNVNDAVFKIIFSVVFTEHKTDIVVKCHYLKIVLKHSI